VWDYSLANIEALAELDVRDVVHVPIGYMSQLTRIPPAAEEDIDVLFYGALVDRRLKILRALRAEGVAVTALFGTFGAARDRAIARARIVLNMHLHEARLFEVVRVSYLLANRRFVISESGQGGDDEAAFAPGLVFADYDDLVVTCRSYLDRPAERQRIADAGFTLLAARSEAEILRAVISEV
jgi:hypothetical protein